MRSIFYLAFIVLVLGGGAAQYGEKFGGRRSEPAALTAAAPAPSQTSGYRTVTVSRDGRGHFQVEGRVEGRRIAFIVDTGATVVALTARDAARLGLRPTRSEFTAEVKTANGVVRAAPVRLDIIDVDGLMVRDVQAIVLPDEALSDNLLGMSYLSRLKRFEYQHGKLVLEQ